MHPLPLPPHEDTGTGASIAWEGLLKARAAVPRSWTSQPQAVEVSTCVVHASSCGVLFQPPRG